MFLAIFEDVDERIANLARRRQHIAVPAIRPEATDTKQEAIHAPGNADHESSHCGGKGLLVFRFHDQVEMVLLHRIVSETKARGVRLTQRSQHCSNDLLAA